MELLVQLGLTVGLLLLAWGVGGAFEEAHFRSIRERERRLASLVAVNFETIPADWSVVGASMVCGSVVVSLDYFKRFLASLRAIVGGRIAAYEPLLDRARREAILRMKAEAQAWGADAIVNVRLETSRLASSNGDGKGTAGVEILAYGTALRRAAES
ncbi:MAG: YbjQ family protein [Myxococcales bacterium]|nr:YbjQ family protein [Myxococcales bacterium]